MATTTAVQTLTLPQQAMLRTSLINPDGTVLAAGFQRALHAESTAKALQARGYLVYLHRRFGYFVYRITDAGRVAAAAQGVVAL